MRPFHYNSNPARVIFGTGTLSQLPDEVARLGLKRALVLSTPHQKADAEAVAAELGSLAAGVFAEAAMHTPVEVTERALAAYAATGADCVVAIGGGSTIGLGKAIALEAPIPQIVVADDLRRLRDDADLGITEGGVKTDRSATPASCRASVIYDPDLTMTLPVGMSRGQRHERHRPCRRGALRPGRQPGDVADGARKASAR